MQPFCKVFLCVLHKETQQATCDWKGSRLNDRMSQSETHTIGENK